MSYKIVAFISDIMTAMSNCSLYSKEHPAVMHLSTKSVAALDSLFFEDKFSIALFGDSMVVNEQPLPTRNMHVSSFMKKLKRKGIDKIVITQGVTATELKNFIAEIALSDRITGAYPHITSGIRETSRLPPAALMERMRKPATGVVFKAQPVTQDCQPSSGLMANSSGVDQMTRPSL